MKEFKIHFSQEAYLKQLKINNILLTRREIDIVACLLHSLKTKKIADILSIEPRTVEKHISNIFAKLECNSREGIIDSLEKSEHILNLRKHCTNLVINSEFEKCLKGVSKKSLPENLKCTLLYDKNHKPEKGLIEQIIRHLELLKIQVNHCKWKHTLRINKEKVIFLCLNNGDQIPEGLDHINFIPGKNYALMIFELLQKLHSPILLDSSISEFKKKYRAIQSQHAPEKVTESFVKKANAFVWEKKWQLAPALLLLCVGIVGLVSWKELIPSQQTQIDSSIRSDLNTPTESVLLQRPEIIAEIDTKLNKMDGIQTVALVGIGGAGKTTLARQYATMQKGSVIWEINAETKDTLLNSFEELAYAISTSETKKKELSIIFELKDPHEREIRLFEFIKRNLRINSNWLLIYDNVDEINRVKKYIPTYSSVWGDGKVLITTRDGNLKNTSFIDEDHIVNIQDLNRTEKCDLFNNIVYGKKDQASKRPKMEEIHTFLESVPPFPLDIITAAYYIKDANITFQEYLERLNIQDASFAHAQEALLEEVSDYSKTRYSIVTLTVSKLIDEQPKFLELLLLISFIDSQNIPIALLKDFEDSVIVDQFLHYLRKRSLISEDYCPEFGQVLSIHRSLQEIAFKFLSHKYNNETVRAASRILKQFSENKQILPSEELETDDNVRKVIPFIPHFKKLCTKAEKLNVLNNDLLKLRAALFEYYVYVTNDLEECAYHIDCLDKLVTGISNVNEKIFSKYLTDKLYVLHLLKDAQTALDTVKQIQSLFDKVPVNSRLKILTSIVQTEIFFGDLDEAKRWDKKIEKLLRNSTINNQNYLGTYQYTKSWLLNEQGHFCDALMRIEQAIDLLEASSLKTAPFYFALNLKAKILLNMGRPQEAIKIAQQSIREARAALGIVNPESDAGRHFISEAIAMLARCNVELNIDLDKTKEELEKTIAQQYHFFGGHKHPDQAEPYIILGDLLHKQSKYDESRNAYIAADGIFHKIYLKKQTLILKNLYKKIIQNELVNPNKSLSVLNKYNNLLYASFREIIPVKID